MKFLGIALCVGIVIAVVLYFFHTGEVDVFVPPVFSEQEVFGAKFGEGFSARLVDDIPVLSFKWIQGAKIAKPQTLPARSTEITFTVTAGGEAASVEVSSISGDSRLDRAVQRAVGTWRYSPFARGWMRIRINWIKAVVAVYVDALVLDDETVKLRRPLVGQDGSFREVLKGQVRW